MDWYEEEVRLLEASIRSSLLPQSLIAFYGSSSIRLWTTLAADFSHLPVLNLGFGGSTLAACVHFFERLVVPCSPHSIVFYAGDNDLGDGQSPEQVQASCQALRKKVLNCLDGVRFVFVSIKLSPARLHLRQHIERTNQLIQTELAHWPAASYLDVYHPMLDANGLPQPELFADDGLHLSPGGYQLWAHLFNAESDKFI